MASQYSVSFHLHHINFLSGTKSCISLLEFFQSGVPTVVQWVKDPTAATRVFVEVGVQSLAWPSGSGSVGHSCGLDSFPGPVTYICYGYIQINTQTIFQLFSETHRVNLPRSVSPFIIQSLLSLSNSFTSPRTSTIIITPPPGIQKCTCSGLTC